MLPNIDVFVLKVKAFKVGGICIIIVYFYAQWKRVIAALYHICYVNGIFMALSL